MLSARLVAAPPRRPRAALTAASVVLTLAASACGTTDQASRDPLPPIRTTTTTTTVPGTTIPEGVKRIWIIERGDTLQKIADQTGVTVQSIIDLNNIENPDSIQAGQELEIPAGIVVINSRGGSTTTEPAG